MAEFESPKPNTGNDLPPIISNNIRIEGILGRGGMGTVYRAKHLSLDRDVSAANSGLIILTATSRSRLKCLAR